MKWETKFGDLHTEQHICSICILLHIQTIRTHIIAACRMRMLNDFYFDIDNIMGKQASPYKIHPCNNIKVFFSVILSSVWPTMWKAASTLRLYDQNVCACEHRMAQKLKKSMHNEKSNIICLFLQQHTLIIAKTKTKQTTAPSWKKETDLADIVRNRIALAGTSWQMSYSFKKHGFSLSHTQTHWQPQQQQQQYQLQLRCFYVQ